jgi:hypothetical protein
MSEPLEPLVESGNTTRLEWNKLYQLGTDVAGFLFFHPARLVHRKDDPIGWWSDDFVEEFQGGQLVAFCTGSDGTFTMKFVRRLLTPTEERVLVAKESFRYDVRDGRLYWENANCLPCEDQFENPDEDENGWLELSNGPYRVTLHALDWFSITDAAREAEADISHYLVQFQPVASLEDIPVPKELPWLLASKSYHEKRVAQQSARPGANPALVQRAGARRLSQVLSLSSPAGAVDVR